MFRPFGASTSAFAVPGAMLFSVFALALFALGAAAQNATTDVGTLDRQSAEKVFPSKPLYSPYAEIGRAHV